MHLRAAQLIRELQLSPHPEGGFFRQFHRSKVRVQPLLPNRPERSALTSIYFLLVAGMFSRWHRVGADEVWHFYEGDELELISTDSEFVDVRREVLGPVGANVRPARVIAAGVWQAARPLGAYTLVGCSVGPGFEFDDFVMLEDLELEAEKVRQRQPGVAGFL
jgi:uncharacterized protein